MLAGWILNATATCSECRLILVVGNKEVTVLESRIILLAEQLKTLYTTLGITLIDI